jgi:hypothetical protein
MLYARITVSCHMSFCNNCKEVLVADSGEGVCVDPGEKGAILETGWPGPPERGKGQQLTLDSGIEEET